MSSQLFSCMLFLSYASLFLIHRLPINIKKKSFVKSKPNRYYKVIDELKFYDLAFERELELVSRTCRPNGVMDYRVTIMINAI
jgi:hypothetical protein